MEDARTGQDDLEQALRRQMPGVEPQKIRSWLQKTRKVLDSIPLWRERKDADTGGSGARNGCYTGVVKHLVRAVQGSLVDHTLVTVADVVGKQSGKVLTSDASGNADTHLLLCGQLSVWKKGDRVGHPGCLLLRSLPDSPSIMCQATASCDLDLLAHLDQWLVCVQWNLRPDPAHPVVEVAGTVVPLTKPALPSPSNIPVLSAQDAALCLHNKSCLPHCLVSLQASVLALSEVFSVKNHNFFMVKMEENINIIIKDPAFLHWQLFLEPHREFVMTDLRPTRLAKSGALGCELVYIPTASSRLLSQPMAQHSCQPLSLQEWLERRGADLDSFSCRHLPQPAPRCEEPLVSYKGMVTSTEKLQFGLIELDKKVLLCVSGVAAIHKYGKLRDGTVVTVYNAVRRAVKKQGTTWLVAGAQTCIRVLQFSPLSCPPSASTFDPSLPVLEAFHSHHLSAAGTVDLASLLLQLSALAPGCSLGQLACPISRETCSWLSAHKRNVISEFVSNSTSVQTERVPKLLPLSELPKGEAKEVDSWSYSLSFHSCQESHQLLVGRLELKSSTGHMTLHDTSHHVNLVTCDSSSTPPHQCSQACVVVPPVGSRVACPYMQPCLQGALVAVLSYAVVQESGGPGSLHYLMVSLQDCVVLAPPPCPAPLPLPPPGAAAAPLQGLGHSRCPARGLTVVSGPLDTGTGERMVPEPGGSRLKETSACVVLHPVSPSPPRFQGKGEPRQTVGVLTESSKASQV